MRLFVAGLAGGVDVPDEYTTEAMADWHHQRENVQAREDLIAASIADVGRVEGFEAVAPGTVTFELQGLSLSLCVCLCISLSLSRSLTLSLSLCFIRISGFAWV